MTKLTMGNTPVVKKYYSPQDLAVYADLGLQTVYNMLGAGKFPRSVAVKIGSQWRIDLEAFDLWVKGQEAPDEPKI